MARKIEKRLKKIVAKAKRKIQKPPVITNLQSISFVTKQDRAQEEIAFKPHLHKRTAVVKRH